MGNVEISQDGKTVACLVLTAAGEERANGEMLAIELQQLPS